MSIPLTLQFSTEFWIFVRALFPVRGWEFSSPVTRHALRVMKFAWFLLLLGSPWGTMTP